MTTNEEYEEVAQSHGTISARVPVMACGHVANSRRFFCHRETGEIVEVFLCVLCMESTMMLHEVLNADGSQSPILREELKDRTAVCSCAREIPSNADGVTFLLHLPKHEMDVWYCGHAGFDPKIVKGECRDPASKVIDLASRAVKSKKRKKKRKPRR